MLPELIAATIQTLEADGQQVPEPLSAYSGMLHLRVPKRLHQALAQEARADGISLNAAAAALLAAGLGVEATARRRGRRGSSPCRQGSDRGDAGLRLRRLTTQRRAWGVG